MVYCVCKGWKSLVIVKFLLESVKFVLKDFKPRFGE